MLIRCPSTSLTVPGAFRLHAGHTDGQMLGGVIRTLTVGPRLVRAILLLPDVLKRLDEIERHAGQIVGNTGSMERSTSALVVGVADMDRHIRHLAEATEPIGRLAGRLPGGRRGEIGP
jgi:hypothetical protein